MFRKRKQSTTVRAGLGHEMELAARVLDAIPEHVERASPLDLGSQPLEELLFHRRAVVLRQLLPLPGLGGENEVHDISRQQTKLPVVVLGSAFPVAAGRRISKWLHRFLDRARITSHGVGPVRQQRPLDRLLEALLGDARAHSLP